MIAVEPDRIRWRIVTDAGSIETVAVSLAKAKRNARFRLIMNDREYSRPMPRDFTAMKAIEILRCEKIGEVARARFFCGDTSASRKRLQPALRSREALPPVVGSEIFTP